MLSWRHFIGNFRIKILWIYLKYPAVMSAAWPACQNVYDLVIGSTNYLGVDGVISLSVHIDVLTRAQGSSI